MKKALVHGDIVTTVFRGPMAGMEIDKSISDLPPMQLRFDGKNIIDMASRDKFAIDDDGNKRLPEMVDEGMFQIECPHDAVLRKVGSKWEVVK